MSTGTSDNNAPGATPALSLSSSPSSSSSINNSGNKNSEKTTITTLNTAIISAINTKVPLNEKTNNTNSNNGTNTNNIISNNNNNSNNNEKNSSVTAIVQAYRNIIADDKSLDDAVNYLYQSLLDDAVIGVFLEIHHLRKTGNLEALDGAVSEAEDDNGSSQTTSMRIVDMPNYDIFGMSTAKKPMDCTCPNCDRLVSAARFAPHLEKCMGMGRISSRIASRRLATKESNSASSSSSSSAYLQLNAGTDDEDDVDWSSEKRRKKNNQNSRNNGSKKNNGKTF